MAEYIKKDELLKFKADVYDESGHVLYAVPTGCIVAMPPSDVVSVLHGRWRCHGDCGVTECSACGWSIEEYVGDYAYCPNCGAMMDGERREDG